jgi:subtilisin family serine protease
MWYKLVSILVICTVLSLSIGQHVVQGNSGSQQSGDVDAMATHVQNIQNEGDANDLIPVIVTLRNPYGFENPIQPRSAKALRRAQIRSMQDDFVMRQSGRIDSIKRKSNIFPIVYMNMRRGDVVQLASDSQVEMIELDRPVPPNMFASTELIGSTIANASGYDGDGMSVAVLDTGVLSSHPFLSGQVVSEACFSTTNSSSTSFCPGGVDSDAVGSAGPCPLGVKGCNHGTHVAGTIAGIERTVTTSAHGTQTIRGVAPAAKIIAVQVFSLFPQSACGATATTDCALSWSSDINAALEWLYDNIDPSAPAAWGKLAAINMSLGGGKYGVACDNVTDVNNPSKLNPYYSTKLLVDQLRLVGVATVIASGNESYSDGVGGPGCISSAITVGASTNNYPTLLTVDQVASFSNAPSVANNGANGNGDRLLDLLAPGYWVYSSLAYPGTTYEYYNGTSMAAPHVAGAWALMKQAVPTASVSQILSWLYSSGTSITDSRNSLVVPRINVDDAVLLALAAESATATPVNTSTTTSTPIVTRTPTAIPTVTRIPRPGTFAKLLPVNNLTNRPLTMTLTWGVSSGASRYEYCVANTATTCTRWVNVHLSRSVVVQNLVSNRTYYWNVRAVNAVGTTVSNGPVWRFTTTSQLLPGAFAKRSPVNNLVNQPLTVTLTWGGSAGANYYEYCYAFTAAICTNWTRVGANSVVVRSLVRNRAYFWQVRAVNSAGQTVSGGGVWRFTTIR